MADEPKSSQSYQEFVKFGKFFSSRLVQAVVQSRLGREHFVPLPCRQSTDPTDWFNIRIDELGEVAAQLRSNITRYPPLSPTLALDFLLQTKRGGILPLETWCVSYDPSEAGEGRYMRTELYQQLSVVLKSVIATARITPSYRYFVRKQSSESYIILYRVSETPIKLDFGDDPKRIRIATVASPFGSLCVDLSFRTNMVFNRPSEEYGEVEKTNASENRLPIFEPDELDLSRRIPFGPVPSSANYIAASPDSDVFTCFSTSPASQNEFPIASSPRGFPQASSPRGSAHFRIGVSPASSNESFACAQNRESDEQLYGAYSPTRPSCSLPERTLDRRFITRPRQPSFPFATLLNASPPSHFNFNRHIIRPGYIGEIHALSSAGPSTAVGLENVQEEELPVPNLRKSSTAPVAVNLLENLEREEFRPSASKDDESSEEGDDDAVFPMTDIFGKVVFGGGEESPSSGPVELIHQCRIANLHQLNFMQENTDTDVSSVVHTLAEFENNSKIFDSFVSEISGDREESFLK